MEKLVEVAILFDYYGELLSKKQFKMVDEYYNEDLSLTEIAELNNISKQAVSENLKRAINRLYGFEKKLNLINKSYNASKLLKNIKDDLNNLALKYSFSEEIIYKDIIFKIDKFLDENAGDNYLWYLKTYRTNYKMHFQN